VALVSDAGSGLGRAEGVTALIVKAGGVGAAA